MEDLEIGPPFHGQEEGLFVEKVKETRLRSTAQDTACFPFKHSTKMWVVIRCQKVMTFALACDRDKLISPVLLGDWEAGQQNTGMNEGRDTSFEMNFK